LRDLLIQNRGHCGKVINIKLEFTLIVLSVGVIKEIKTMIYDEWVFHDVEHIYLQLAKKVRCAIYSGQLSIGEKIPSVRDMAKILHVNSNTVMRVYKIVRNDKLIVSYRNGQFRFSEYNKKNNALRDCF